MQGSRGPHRFHGVLFLLFSSVQELIGWEAQILSCWAMEDDVAVRCSYHLLCTYATYFITLRARLSYLLFV